MPAVTQSFLHDENRPINQSINQSNPSNNQTMTSHEMNKHAPDLASHHINNDRTLVSSVNQTTDKQNGQQTDRSIKQSIKSSFQDTVTDLKGLKSNNEFNDDRSDQSSDDQSADPANFSPARSPFAPLRSMNQSVDQQTNQPIFRSHSTPESLKHQTINRSLNLSPTYSESIARSLVHTPFTDRLNAILRTPVLSVDPSVNASIKQISSIHHLFDNDSDSSDDDQSMSDISQLMNQSPSPDCSLSPSRSLMFDRMTSSDGSINHSINRGDLSLAGELGLRLVEENAALAAALSNEQSLKQSVIDELKLEQSINQSIIDELNYYRFKVDQLSNQSISHERSTSPVETTPLQSRRQSFNQSNHSSKLSISQSMYVSPDDQLSMSQCMALASLRDLLRHELHESPSQSNSPSSESQHHLNSPAVSQPTGDLHNDLQLFRRQLIKERRDLSIAIKSLEQSVASISEAHNQSINQIKQLNKQRNQMDERLRLADEAARMSKEEFEETVQSIKQAHRTELREAIRHYDQSVKELRQSIHDLKEDNATLSKELLFERAEQQRLRERFDPPPKYETPHHRRSKSVNQIVNQSTNSSSASDEDIQVSLLSMTTATLSPTPLELYASAHHQRTHSLKDQIDCLTDNESTPVKRRVIQRDDDLATPPRQHIQPDPSATPSTNASATVPCEQLMVTAPVQRSASPLEVQRPREHCVHCFPLECSGVRAARSSRPVRQTSWTTYFISIFALVALSTLGIKRGALRHFR